MAFLFWGRDKKEKEEQAVQTAVNDNEREGIINENRERANRIILALKKTKQKIDVEFANVDDEAKIKYVKDISNLEDSLEQSGANDQKDAQLVDEKIQECLRLMFDSIEQMKVKPIEQGVACLQEALKLRSKPNSDTLARIGYFIDKMKLIMDMVSINNELDEFETKLEEEKQKAQKAHEAYKNSVKADESEEIQDNLYELWERAKKQVSRYETDISARRQRLSEIDSIINTYDTAINRERIMSAEEYQRLRDELIELQIKQEEEEAEIDETVLDIDVNTDSIYEQRRNRQRAKRTTIHYKSSAAAAEIKSDERAAQETDAHEEVKKAENVTTQDDRSVIDNIFA